ncbi:MAG: hypothetical protein CBC29_07070 [Methylococcaceae bacterium TMED69]|nr:MAG: hypothetical protein CBC29_07070 [Methylococcaceae bacterium TMED69]
MRLTEKKLRTLIRKQLMESAGVHRCLNGSMVPNDSVECYEDICLRIEDAVHQRDSLGSGTASRSYYNGVLADLRKKKRRLGKLHTE